MKSKILTGISLVGFVAACLLFMGATETTNWGHIVAKSLQFSDGNQISGISESVTVDSTKLVLSDAIYTALSQKANVDSINDYITDLQWSSVNKTGAQLSDITTPDSNMEFLNNATTKLDFGRLDISSASVTDFDDPDSMIIILNSASEKLDSSRVESEIADKSGNDYKYLQADPTTPSGTKWVTVSPGTGDVVMDGASTVGNLTAITGTNTIAATYAPVTALPESGSAVDSDHQIPTVSATITALDDLYDEITADIAGITPDYSTDNFELNDPADPTKVLKFNASNISPNTTRTGTMPDASGVFVLEANTATLTNKEIPADQNTITGITNASIAENAAIDVAKISDGTVTDTDFRNTAGSTGNLQAQINAKASAPTGAITSVVNTDLTPNRVVGSDGSGKITTTSVTPTELSTINTDITNATSANTVSTIVKRDSSGNFSAGTITANLTGNVTGNVTGTASSVTGTVPVANGGTGGTDAPTALSNLGASPVAGSSSITTVGTITSGTWNGAVISVSNGGTGASSAELARNNLGAAESGTNNSISSMTGLNDDGIPLSKVDDAASATTLSSHTSAFNPHSGSAESGANSSISSLSGLTTPLSIPQGGTGADSIVSARTNLEAQIDLGLDQTYSVGGAVTYQNSSSPEIYTRTFTSYIDWGSESDVTARMIISARDLPIVRGVNSMRITMSVYNSGGLNIEEGYIANQASSGDPYDYDPSTMVALKWGGNTYTTIMSNTPFTSDYVNFSWDGESDLVVIIAQSTPGITTISFRTATSSPNETLYWKLGNDAATADVTGYTEETGESIISSIEVQLNSGYYVNRQIDVDNVKTNFIEEATTDSGITIGSNLKTTEAREISLGGNLNISDGTNTIAFFDRANKRWGINTPTPTQDLDVNGTIKFGTNGYLYNTSNVVRLESTGAEPLSFSTNNTERIRIDSSGYVGIGIVNPSYQLHSYKSSGTIYTRTESASLAADEEVVNAAVGKKSGGSYRVAYIGVRYNPSSTSNETCGYMFLQPSDGGDDYVWVDDSDFLHISANVAHIGTASGFVVGDQTSDIRLKNIHGKCNYGLTEILQLDTKLFSFKNDKLGTRHVGFIAQQAREIIPESVYDTGEKVDDSGGTKLAMRYYEIVPVLVNAIKEQQAHIDDLKLALWLISLSFGSLFLIIFIKIDKLKKEIQK